MKKYLAILAMLVPMLAQDTAPVNPPADQSKLTTLKFELERDRRRYWANNAQYQNTLTDQQKELLSIIQQQERILQAKLEELKKQVACTEKQIFDEETLECVEKK